MQLSRKGGDIVIYIINVYVFYFIAGPESGVHADDAERRPASFKTSDNTTEGEAENRLDTVCRRLCHPATECTAFPQYPTRLRPNGFILMPPPPQKLQIFPLFHT